MQSSKFTPNKRDEPGKPLTPPSSLSPLYWSSTPATHSTKSSVLLRSRRSSRRRRDLLLDLPIAGRLALAFLVAALIAAVASGIIGFQRSQSLTHQSNFYQNLLQTNTSLTGGESFLQLMNVEGLTLVTDANAPVPSQETLKMDEAALQGLTSRYNDMLTAYIAHDLVEQHADEFAILTEANHADLADQQRALASSTLRTWTFYRAALSQLLTDVTTGNLNNASYIERYQAEPTNADAQSALRSLVRLDARLASSIQAASNVEVQNQIITTIISAIIACLCIIIVGWIISNTLIRRLVMLQKVAQQVEQGHLESRAIVIGRDEIADVSLSMNTMLDTIVGLLEDAQHQRDMLTGAAHKLFSQMKVMSAGELHTNSTSTDPMDLLSDAFNFTIGRFRRFMTRTQTHIEQLEAVSRRGIEQADTFLRALRSYSARTSVSPVHETFSATPSRSGPLVMENTAGNAVKQVDIIHERFAHMKREVYGERMMSLLATIDTTILVLLRLQTHVAPALSLAQKREWQEAATSLQRLREEAQAIQGESLRTFASIDHETLYLTEMLQRSDVQERQERHLGYDHSSELIRMSTAFLQEVVALTRQVNAVSQEMRATVTSFKSSDFEDIK